MSRPRVIKSITPVLCPHCSKTVYVCQSFLQPTLTWIISDDEMAKHKATLKELLKSVVFKTAKAEAETMSWIDSDECVFGPEDLEDIAKDIAREQKE